MGLQYTKPSVLPTLSADNISKLDSVVISHWTGSSFSSRAINYNSLSASIANYVSGVATLSALNDVDISTITDGDIIKWNESLRKFKPESPVAVTTGTHLLTNGTIHTDVATGITPADEDILCYNSASGSKWTNISRKTPIVYKTSTYTIPTTVVTQTCFCNNSNNTIYFYLTNSSTCIGKEYTFAKFPGYIGSIIIQAPYGVTIADSSSAGTVYNNIDSETFANITLLCITATYWIIKSAHGTWTTT